MIDERVFGEDLSEFGGAFVDEVQRGNMFLYDHKQSWKGHVSFPPLLVYSVLTYITS